jgi:hypothetical protein
MPRTAPSANSRGVALLSAALATTACTSILGIDNNYYSERANSDGSTGGKPNESGGRTSITPKTGGASNVAHHDAGSNGAGGTAGGGTSSGGRAQDASIGGHTNRGASGNETSSGGTSSGGNDNGGSGGTSESGGTSASGGDGGSTGMTPEAGDGSVCPLGTYTGTYSGRHRSSTGGTAVAAPVNGSITLRFTTTSPTARMITGGVGFLPTATSGGFVGTFVGTFDCETKTGSVTLNDPTNITTIVPPLYVLIEGTFQIQPGPNGGVQGTFSEHETAIPTATGSGTWSTN